MGLLLLRVYIEYSLHSTAMVRKQKTNKSAASKAKKAAKANAKGTRTQRKITVRTSCTFRRPKTLELKRNPKYQRKDHFQIIRYPLTTESSMKKIEDNNTLVFIVDWRANKYQIRDAMKSLYDVKAEKINTLIRPDGNKKAFVKLSQDYDALDVANKIGII